MLIGRFYFRQTHNGNLVGEFSNNLSGNNATESGDQIFSGTGPFLGTYKTTWQEEGDACFSVLSITNKEHATNIFSLIWSRDNAPIFWGEGFVVDGLLIGDYRDQESIPAR